tara:strand:+ start:34226 stop:35536 length:1311 start_codon:yes stop_codon:yes gene_type:complete
MNSNWEIIRTRWPTYRVGDSDASLVDVSDCVFLGEGRHEFAVYSFGRYLRCAQRRPEFECPVGIQFGIHFPDYVPEESPAIGHLRTRFSNDTTGLVEPVKLLAIVATDNGPEFWSRLWQRLEKFDRLDSGLIEAERWLRADVTELLDAVGEVCLMPLPPFQVMSRSGGSSVSISLADIPEPQFAGYYPGEDELSPLRTGRWAYDLKKSIKNDGRGRQESRERVVLTEDLRRVDDSLFKGQLGWTDPDRGFSIKKGGSSLQVAVTFDSDVQLNVNVYWIDFIREDAAAALSQKMIDHFRGTPFDADTSVAGTWTRDFPFYIPAETRIIGRGLDEVYAYTFRSCVERAAESGHSNYPMKIGYTSGVDGALQRIVGQFPAAIADDARLQFIGRCSEGRKVEGKIQKHIRDSGRKLNSPGREWFSTTVDEVEALFKQHAD